MLATHLTDGERHYVERRLAEEQLPLCNPTRPQNFAMCSLVRASTKCRTPTTRSFICQCVQCAARIWVAHSSPIEPIRLCRSCAKAQERNVEAAA